jgi:alkylation response protein AidB-like acyl-CoA dehydrogenase
MKECALLLAERALRRFGKDINKEQEILLAFADMVIQIFALESVLLRAEKTLDRASAAKDEQYRAAVLVCAFSGRQHFIAAAEKCAAFLACQELLPVIGEKTQLATGDVLTAKRLLADAVLQAEKYIF